MSSLLRPSSIPLGWTTFWLSIHLPTGLRAVPTLWSLTYKLPSGHVSSFLLGVHLGAELLGHRVTSCLTF